jgi:hypothetical protein
MEKHSISDAKSMTGLFSVASLGIAWHLWGWWGIAFAVVVSGWGAWSGAFISKDVQ